jgi:acyl-CoA synthetase (AMP-forming)/AMP-acid ligase II
VSLDRVPSTLVELLRVRGQTGTAGGYGFLDEAGTVADELSFPELDRRARAIAAVLGRTGAPGDRVLLLYPSGLDYVEAFYGCLYAGRVAVPVYPPGSERTLPRLSAVVEDARPATVLTTSRLRERVEDAGRRVEALGALPVLATDAIDGAEADVWRDPRVSGETEAFLQYTSGSTRTPRGVVLRHRHLLDNQRAIRRAFGQSAESVVVSWLPLYHDMGLIGGVLQPLYVGGRCLLMSPVSFLQKPARWLEAIDRYRATTSGGPNFAYDLCVRRVPEAARPELDLSSWRVAFNGAEPVRAETLRRFAQAFAVSGFRAEAFFPCYGLAEATLFVTGRGPDEPVRIEAFTAAELERGRAVPAEAGASDGEAPPARSLVSSGRPADET